MNHYLYLKVRSVGDNFGKISFYPFSKVYTQNLGVLLFTARSFVYLAIIYFISGLIAFSYGVHEVVDVYNFEQQWTRLLKDVYHAGVVKIFLWDTLMSGVILVIGGLLAAVVSFEFMYKNNCDKAENK